MFLALAYQLPPVPPRKPWITEDMVKGLTTIGLIALLSWGGIQQAPVHFPRVDFDQQQPVSAPQPMPAAETDLFKWAVTQGGLTVVILAFLWFDRRERQRDKEEAKRDREELKSLISDLRDEKKALLDQLRDEKHMLAQVVDKNTTSQQSVALAVAGNTQATQTLATNVDRLERSLGKQ